MHAEGQDFDVYNIPDALAPEAPMDGSIFLNGELTEVDLVRCTQWSADPRTRAAIHAPTSKDWVSSINYPFGKPLRTGVLSLDYNCL